METRHTLEQAKKTIEVLSQTLWDELGLSTTNETEATLSAINEKLNPTDGIGHQVKADLKIINVVANLDRAISEAHAHAYSIDEALTANA